MFTHTHVERVGQENGKTHENPSYALRRTIVSIQFGHYAVVFCDQLIGVHSLARSLSTCVSLSLALFRRHESKQKEQEHARVCV